MSSTILEIVNQLLAIKEKCGNIHKSWKDAVQRFENTKVHIPLERTVYLQEVGHYKILLGQEHSKMVDLERLLRDAAAKERLEVGRLLKETTEELIKKNRYFPSPLVIMHKPKRRYNEEEEFYQPFLDEVIQTEPAAKKSKKEEKKEESKVAAANITTSTEEKEEKKEESEEMEAGANKL
uniref:Uncharacterized protein n=1 Tax=Panagrolaimus superbus TaxID=310955 RepID=A0A914Y6P4_9BILA